MDEKQFGELVAKVGSEAALKIKSEMDAYKSTMEGMMSGKLSAEEFKSAQAAINASVEEVKNIAAKQGTTLSEISAKLNTKEVGTKSVAEQLKEDSEELRSIFKNRNGVKEYMLSVNEKGAFVMKPFDSTKAAGVTASVAGINSGSSSVAQSIDATSLLRLGGNAPIVSQFRNKPWIFDLVNLINTGFDNPFFLWFDEQAKQGASANVAEGGTKPLTQYAYTLNSSPYKKEAVMVSMTQEFSLDFDRLQSDIIAKAQIDLINRINSAILPNITSAATAYNSAVAFKNGAALASANDWVVLAALAAQAENATFSSMANAAIISTNKKYRMGILTDQYGQWLNGPSILDNVSLVSNPAQATNAVMVGDFKQYNVALRGGIIVKVGYNGTDFANNMFSTVIEQFYFDYISSVRAAAIVKGPDFATVATALTT